MIELPTQYKGRLYAVLGDNNVICGVHIGQAWMPLVFLDPEKLPSIRIMAQTVANLSGRQVHVYEFTVGKIVETIQPQYMTPTFGGPDLDRAH